MWGEISKMAPSILVLSSLPAIYFFFDHSLSLRGSDAENNYSFLYDCGPSPHSSYLTYVGVQLELVDCWGFTERASYCQKESLLPLGRLCRGSSLRQHTAEQSQVTVNPQVHRTVTVNPASCHVPSHATSHSILVTSL